VKLLGRRRQERSGTRLLFATDLHAGEQTFRKLLNAPPIYGADVVILGGDLTGKVVAPIVQDNGRYQATLLGEPVNTDADGLEDLERAFRDLGFYPVHLDAEEYERMRDDRTARDAMVETVLHEQVERWLALAAQRLGESGRPLYVTGGNDDPLSIEPILDHADYAINAESCVVRIDARHEMASTGYGNPTPWSCPRDIREEDLVARIEGMLAGVLDMPAAIFNFHVPPFDSTLDVAPRLDTSVDPPAVIPGDTAPVGSRAVREAIERHQPMLALHGHIHESRGVVKIGRTVCVNPGSEYGEGILRAAIIDIDDGAVQNVQLVAG
jgi:Icc-related predicted phosphoesterase